MGRRRSGSGTTRILQVIFAFAWIAFFCYMIFGYLKKPEDSVVKGDSTSIESTPGSETESPSLTNPPLTNPPASTFAGKSTPAIPQITSGPTAQKILQDTIAAYRNATAYSDQGTLHLESRINGSPHPEEYPWSTAWAKDGRISADVFDTKLRGDGKMLSCFVSDIKSENVKNQQLFLNGGQLIQQLYRDKIANYYLNGGEKIPINDELVPNNTLLMPAPLALLNGAAQSPWLRSGAAPKRLTDQTVDGFACHVISCPSQYGDLLAWIDKSSSLIRKIQLPNNLLDPLFAADLNVKDVKLFAKFTGARFNANTVAFERVAPKAGVWPVREFVAPVDPLPTNLLGEMAPEFSLLSERREKVTDRQLAGKPIALLLLQGGDSDTELIGRLDAVRKSVGPNMSFAVVVGPNAIQRGANDSWALIPSIQPAANKTEIPILADLSGLETSKFELHSLPAVVLLDSKLDIQYAELLSKSSGFNGTLEINQKWDQRLAAAISETAKGVNVADDMKANYRNYLDQYFKDRDQRLVASSFPGFVLPQSQKVAAVPVNVRRDQTVNRSKLKLNPKLVWESGKLRSPGNIALLSGPGGDAKLLLVMDGWQTVALFDVDGKPISRKTLELPEGVAVTAIRPVASANGEKRFAMFSVGGKQVFIFDGSMDLVGSYPELRDARDPVLACETLPGGRGKDDQLLICFGGSGGGKMFDPFTKEVRSIGSTAVRALALSGKSVIAADDRTGALLSMSGGGRVIDDRREYTQIVDGADGASVFAATVMNNSQEWSLVGLDSALKERWSFPIASTVFDNGIEPVSGISTASGKGTWAVADATNRIYLLSDTGTWLGDMAADGKVRGLKLMSSGQRTWLVVSTDKKIECWDLNFAPERVGSVGGRIE